MVTFTDETFDENFEDCRKIAVDVEQPFDGAVDDIRDGLSRLKFSEDKELKESLDILNGRAPVNKWLDPVFPDDWCIGQTRRIYINEIDPIGQIYTHSRNNYKTTDTTFDSLYSCAYGTPVCFFP